MRYSEYLKKITRRLRRKHGLDILDLGDYWWHAHWRDGDTPAEAVAMALRTRA